MPTLRTTRYVPPGSYLGQIIVPEVTGLTGRPRIPCFVGRGSRYARVRNAGIRRSYVYEEALSFTVVAPYQAVLPHAADMDMTSSDIYRSDGSTLPKEKWSYFSSTIVEIVPQEFDPTETYTISYQSTSRDVLDPLPIDEIRNEIKVGRSPDQEQFEEYTDYLIAMGLEGDAVDIDALQADSGNTYIAASQRLLAGIGNAGGGVATFTTGAAYTHDYNRKITVLFKNPVGVASIDVYWWSEPISPGNSNLAADPLVDGLTLVPATYPTEFHESLAVADGGTVVLEHGLSIDLDLTANFVDGDTYDVWGQGPGLMEFDSRHLNTNQYLEVSAVTKTGAGLGVVTVDDATAFAGSGNRRFWLQVIAVAGETTFMWGAHHEGAYAGSTLVTTWAAPPVDTETFTIEGVEFTVDKTAGAFVIGDIFWWDVSPARLDLEFKDDRSYTFTVNGAPTADDVNFIYVTTTREGQSGAADAANVGYVNPAGSTTGLPGNFRVHARNIDDIALLDMRYGDGDIFTCDVTCSDTIDWRLEQLKTDTFTTDDLIYDALGTITGVAMTYYLVLSHTPVSITSVVDPATGNPITYVAVTGTPYIYFATAPSTSIQVNFIWRGDEPAPGDLYYLTANYLRPSTWYNEPQLFTSYSSARAWLIPVTPENDLMIMLDIIEPLFAGGLQAVYIVQVRDADDDGTFTDVDFQNAIDGTETKSDIKDVIVLNHFTVLNYLLSSINNMNDPFEAKERMAWIGCPATTPVGDASTSGSLIYYAKNTLQVYGESVAHGTRILVAPTEVKKTILQEDNTTIQLTLDGSFLAGYLAALTCSFAVPAATILRTTVGVFDRIETFSEGDNLMLGAAGLVYTTDRGASIYRVETDTTTDTFANNFQYISAMTQKHFVVGELRYQTDTKLIGLVPSSADSGASLVRGVIAGVMRNLLARGLIARYQDDAGNERDFSVTNDVIAWRDETTPTLYHYNVAFWLLYPIERVFGLYMVDSNQFGRA